MKAKMFRNQTMTRTAGILLASSLLASSLLAAGCSGGETRPDDQQAEQRAEPAQQQVDERGIPQLVELESADEDAPVEQLGEANGVTAYKVGDVTVLHKATPANSVVAARVYISGGSANLTEQTAGIERLALNTAVNGGTESHSKDEFNSLLDSTGSTVNAFTDRDFSGYLMKSVVDNFDTTWDLMVEAMVEPVMPDEELELQRQRHLADIRSLQENPDRLMSYTASKLLFKGHPYHTLQLGTEENVSAFSRDQVAAYQRALLQPERMTVVVVGNVDDDQVVEKVQQLARLRPQTTIPSQELTSFDADEAELEVRQKEIPTNYINGLFAAPAPGHDDYEAMLVAVEYLRDRLFEEVRTKRNLTYAVSSGLGDARVNYGYLYVTAVNPDETMPVMFDEVEKLKRGEFSDEQLEESRNVFITEHYMDQETNGSQASLLARAHLIAGDWRSQADAIDRLEAVTGEDVQRVANEYMNNYHFGIVGTPDQIDEGLFLDGAPAEDQQQGEDVAEQQ